MTGSACVYTALIGGYEVLNEQPVALNSDLDFVCFTDDPDLTSTTWNVVRVTPAWPTDLVRSSRALKILGHPDLAGYRRTIWVDNSAIFLRDPGFVLEHVDHAPIALVDHWDRQDVFAEFAAVLHLGLDDPHRLYEQLNAYALVRPEVLEEKPYATTIMVRRQGSEVLDRAMRLWMDHVLRYSRRDQLSVNWVLAETGLPVERFLVDPRNSDWVSWPHTVNRDRHRGLGRPALLAMPPMALAEELGRRGLEMEEELARVSRERDILRSEIEATAELHARERDILRSQIEATAELHTSAAARWEQHSHQLNELVSAQERAIADLRSSTSWRATRFLRVLGDLFRSTRTRVRQR